MGFVICDQVLDERVERLGQDPAELSGSPHAQPAVGRLERNVDTLVCSPARPDQAQIYLKAARELAGEIDVIDVLRSREMKIAWHAPLADARQGISDKADRHRRENQI